MLFCFQYSVYEPTVYFTVMGNVDIPLLSSFDATRQTDQKIFAVVTRRYLEIATGATRLFILIDKRSTLFGASYYQKYVTSISLAAYMTRVSGWGWGENRKKRGRGVFARRWI